MLCLPRGCTVCCFAFLSSPPGSQAAGDSAKESGTARHGAERSETLLTLWQANMAGGLRMQALGKKCIAVGFVLRRNGNGSGEQEREKGRGSGRGRDQQIRVQLQLQLQVKLVHQLSVPACAVRLCELL